MSRELIFSATKKDFRIDWFSGTGPGGQNRNKVQACCRITHIPTGLTQVGQTERSRERNFRDAFGRLAKLVVSKVLDEQNKKSRNTNEETIRTYHQPRNNVKDHSSGFVQTYKEVVDKLNLDEMILARAKSEVTRV